MSQDSINVNEEILALHSLIRKTENLSNYTLKDKFDSEYIKDIKEIERLRGLVRQKNVELLQELKKDFDVNLSRKNQLNQNLGEKMSEAQTIKTQLKSMKAEYKQKILEYREVFSKVREISKTKQQMREKMKELEVQLKSLK